MSQLCPDLKDEVGSLKEIKARYAHVPKNAKGGVLVTNAILNETFAVLSGGKEKFGMRDLKKVKAFFPAVDDKDLTLLLGDGKQMTLEELEFVLKDNIIANYDPAKEAWRAFTDERGHFSVDRFKAMHEALGLQPPSDEDCKILAECAAKDGKTLNLGDFRQLVAYADSRAAHPKDRIAQPPKEEY